MLAYAYDVTVISDSREEMIKNSGGSEQWCRESGFENPPRKNISNGTE